MTKTYYFVFCWPAYLPDPVSDPGTHVTGCDYICLCCQHCVTLSMFDGSVTESVDGEILVRVVLL